MSTAASLRIASGHSFATGSRSERSRLTPARMFCSRVRELCFGMRRITPKAKIVYHYGVHSVPTPASLVREELEVVAQSGDGLWEADG
jgi:hypothetical protein